jgi:hypothetical protein
VEDRVLVDDMLRALRTPRWKARGVLLLLVVGAACWAAPLVRARFGGSERQSPFREGDAPQESNKRMTEPAVSVRARPVENRVFPAHFEQRSGGDSRLAHLELKSTIVGISHKAALINDRFYPEGSEIEVDGKRFVVDVIEPHRVVLRNENEVRFLTIGASSHGAGSEIRTLDVQEDSD